MRLLQVIVSVSLMTAGVFLAAPSAARAASNMSFGVTIGPTLPADAAPVRVGRDTYFAYHGSFYRQLKAGFVLVPAPRGATITELPRGATKFTVGKITYYQHAGVYFKSAGRKFQVCDAPTEAPIADVAGHGTPPPELAVQLGEDVYVFRRGRFFLNSPDGLLGRSTPVGGVTRDFPPDAMSVWFRDSEYFEANGVFFQETPRGFQVVAPPWQRPPAVSDEAATQVSAN